MALVSIVQDEVCEAIVSDQVFDKTVVRGTQDPNEPEVNHRGAASPVLQESLWPAERGRKYI